MIFNKFEVDYTTDINLGMTNHNSAYQYSNIYEEYIISKIDNEEKIASHLRSIIPVQEAKYRNLRTLNESTLGDKAKNRFNKIIAFVKNLLAKFAESISSFLLDNKDYLEKYKDIILKKQPKSDNKYSYTGDYKLGMQRCMDFQIKPFNYDKYANTLNLVGEEDAEKARIAISKEVFDNHEAFSYTSGDNLGDKAKEFFLAWEKGDQEGTFDDGKLNFTDMYNFCYNVGQITKIKTRDEKYIEDANKKILTEIENQIKEKQNKADTNTDTSGNKADTNTDTSGNKADTNTDTSGNKADTNTDTSGNKADTNTDTSGNKADTNTDTSGNKADINAEKDRYQKLYSQAFTNYDHAKTEGGKKTYKKEMDRIKVEAGKKGINDLQDIKVENTINISALDKYRNMYLMENNGGSTPQNNNSNDKSEKPKNNLKITPANNAITAISKNNTNEEVDAKAGANGAADSENELSDIQTLGDRYLQVVRTVIAARCTALEQMARNFMEIIRAHVRSYVGNADDASTDKSQQAGNTYQRNDKSENNQKPQNQNGGAKPEGESGGT